MCLTEHHLKYLQLEKFHIENYNLGAHYCRQQCEKGGVAIFVHNSLGFINIHIAQHCKDQDIEICALKLSFGTQNICTLTLYRAPSCKFSTFLLQLDTILQSIYTPRLHFIICGDINIIYLNESGNKSQLDNLLLSYNLTSIINFLTRIQNISSTATDNISIDVSQLESYTLTPIINRVSDHDAQLLTISIDYSYVPTHWSKTVRKINKYTISDFIDKLSCESWDSIFDSEDVNAMFNSFLNIYLRIFYSSFPLQKVTNCNNNDNNWITLGIKTSRRHKRDLYLISRNSNDEKLKRHYQAYCKILLKVIKEAKKLYYDTKIKKSNNKCRATWEIIKTLTNNHYSHTDIQELMIDNKHLKDQQDIADAFNDYFSSTVDNINKNKVNNKNYNAKVFLTQYYLEQNYVHPHQSLVI